MDWVSPEEEQSQILFHSHEVDFALSHEEKYQSWILQILANEKKDCGVINYIFCDDDYLLKKNQSYLQHDTLTDIITFEYSNTPISADIFISIDRVKENAADRKLSIETELHRVMAHGILHLCGYGDKSDTDIKIMRIKEEESMRLFS